MKNPNTEEVVVVHLNSEQEKNKSNFTDPATGADMEVIQQEPLLEWLANNYKNFGAILEIVTDRYAFFRCCVLRLCRETRGVRVTLVGFSAICLETLQRNFVG